MSQFQEGDRVRIDIPDEDDPDFNLHRSSGEVVEILEDDAGTETGDPRDSVLIRVQMDDGRTRDFRWRDVRPE